jgi:hypothetical protein
MKAPRWPEPTSFWGMIAVAVALLLGGTLIAETVSAFICFLFPVCK